MWFNLVPINIWAETVPSGYSDPEWSRLTTISGTFIPVSGREAIRNNQDFSDVRRMISCSLSYADYLKANYETEIDDEWFRILHVEKYKNVLPHIEVYLGDSQWRRD